MKRLEATVHGRVQGVNFRHHTQRQAARLGVTGWVANQADGTVRVVAEGSANQLEQMEQFLHRGSPSARVERVATHWKDASGEFSSFNVRWL